MNPSPRYEELANRLDTYLETFRPTVTLVEDLIEARRDPQEILILLCARLDALATGSAREDRSRKRAFCDFIAQYGGHRRLFESVSIGDLYYELGYHRWLMEGMIPVAGRIQRFSRLNQPIIQFLQDIPVPLTAEDCERVLTRMMTALRGAFRAFPGQRRTKSHSGKLADVQSTIIAGFKGRRDAPVVAALPQALPPLLKTKTIGILLYERFRSEAIHGGRVSLEESRFFREEEPYWASTEPSYFGRFHLVEFPGPFLLNTLVECIRRYRQHLLHRGKLPPDVHFAAFDDEMMDHLEFLDEALLPDTKELRLRND